MALFWKHDKPWIDVIILFANEEKELRHLGGLPWPCEWVWVKVAQSCPALCDPMDYTVMEFSRQEHWSEWPFPSPRDLPDPGIKLASPALALDSLPTVQPGKFNPNHWITREFLVWVFFKYYLPWTPCLVPFDKCYAFLQHTHTNLILLDQETIEGTCMFIPL